MKKLKRIELNDILEISKMLKSFWKTQLVEASDNDILEDIGRMLNPKCISALIMVDDNIAGFIFVNEKYGYFNNIEYLFIKDEYRSQGLGTFALQEITKIIYAKANTRAQIEVSPMNVSALKLYRQLGFKYIDTITLSTNLIGDVCDFELNNLDFKVNTEEAFKKHL